MFKRFVGSVLLVAALSMGIVLYAGEVSYAADGSSAGDAFWATGDAHSLPARSEQWYRFDVGGRKASVTASLDAYTSDGLRLAIYTPAQIQAWINGEALKPIGVGSAQAGHALVWDGEFNEAGTYYAVAYNDSASSVEIRVRVTGDEVTTSFAVPPTRQPDPLNTPTPLGKRILGKLVFVDASGGSIYTVMGDGSNLERVTFGLDPVWSHSGTQIAFARQGPTPGVYVINADGSNERLLYQTNEPRAPVWSPDDSEIVFSFRGQVKGGQQRCIRDRCFDTPETIQWKLGSVSLADGTYRDVRSSEDAFTPTFNPDGTIAYNDPSIGLLRTTLTGAPEPDPFIGDLRITSDSYNPLRIMSPQYSPDGNSITYMVQQPPTWQLALANADGSAQRLLTRNNVLAYYHPSNVAPEWSPDSKQILFLSDRNGRWEFFTMNRDGTNVTQVLKNISDQIPIRYDFQAGRMMSWSR